MSDLVREPSGLIHCLILVVVLLISAIGGMVVVARMILEFGDCMYIG